MNSGAHRNLKDYSGNKPFFRKESFTKETFSWTWIKGGAEKRIYEIANRLTERGDEVHWFGLKRCDGEEDIMKY